MKRHNPLVLTLTLLFGGLFIAGCEPTGGSPESTAIQPGNVPAQGYGTTDQGGTPPALAPEPAS